MSSIRAHLTRLVARIRPDALLLAAVMVCCNLHLLFPLPADVLIFVPGRVANGEWWRVFTHPFVHVSWYHLALDAGAFVLLYAQLPWRTAAVRLGVSAVCAAGSLLGVMLMQPEVAGVGLCGLSGTAHGLMALVSAMQVAQRDDRLQAALGGISLVVLIGKSIYEAATGAPAFAFLHFGCIGSPLLWSHAAGVAAGMGMALLIPGCARRIPLAARQMS